MMLNSDTASNKADALLQSSVVPTERLYAPRSAHVLRDATQNLQQRLQLFAQLLLVTA